MRPLPAIVSVLYATGKPFDLDYYLSTHMPLVTKSWTPQGLLDWRIISYNDTLAGSPPPFQIEAILYFTSIEAFKDASVTPEGVAVFADVPNFTPIEPVVAFGQQEASWSKKGWKGKGGHR